MTPPPVTQPPVTQPGATLERPAPPARRRRIRHPARWLAGLVLLALVVVAIVVATRPTVEATQISSPLVGRPAPPLAGTDLAGQPVRLADLRGRYVYVNFFASWCPPCQQEEPDLVAFQFRQQRAPGGAAVLSVVFNDSEAAARRFVRQWGQVWPAVADRDGSIANAFGVSSPPMTFLVNPRGTVVGAYAGPATADQLQAMLAAARGRHG